MCIACILGDNIPNGIYSKKIEIKLGQLVGETIDKIKEYL